MAQELRSSSQLFKPSVTDSMAIPITNNIMNTTTPSSNSLSGHLMAFAAMASFGIMSPVAKLLFVDDCPMDSMTLSSLRLIAPALVLLLIFPFLPKQKIERKDIFRLIIMSLCGLGISMYSYTIGVGLTIPSHAGILTTLPPIFVLILSAIFLKQKIDWGRASGIAFAMVGVLILVFSAAQSDSGSASLLGDGLCLFTQMLLACYFVFFIDIIKRYHPLFLLSLIFGISAISSLPFVAADLVSFPWAEMSTKAWIYSAVIVFACTLIPYLLITGAQRRLLPSVVVCYNYIQPLIALALSLAWGLELMSWSKGLAIIFILLGLSLVIQVIKIKK